MILGVIQRVQLEKNSPAIYDGAIQKCWTKTHCIDDTNADII